jgi:hypothetical protein
VIEGGPGNRQTFDFAGTVSLTQASPPSKRRERWPTPVWLNRHSSNALTTAAIV